MHDDLLSAEDLWARARSRTTRGAHLVLYAAAQIGLAYVGSATSGGPDHIAFFWPASGLALGVLLCVPVQRWPAFLLAGVLPVTVFNVLVGESALVAAAFAVGNVVEPVVGAWLAIRLANGRPRLSRPGSLFFALVVGGPVVAASGASALSTLALVGGHSGFLEMWLRQARRGAGDAGRVATGPFLGRGRLARTTVSPAVN